MGKEKTKKVNKEKEKDAERLELKSQRAQKGKADNDGEEEDWTHTQRKSPPTSEDLGGLLNKDSPQHKGKMSKIMS